MIEGFYQMKDDWDGDKMRKIENTFNPILPLDEYIPDGEPHIFGDRIYLFGSHDTEGGRRYCAEENYVGWSAPLSDPSAWEYMGIIYEATQDPEYKEGVNTDLYAPDVVQGNDGRYYLYYGFADGHNKVNVAVCDTPAGRYEYLGFVRNPDGTPHCKYSMADPAVINDDGVIRLYAGWSLSMVAAEAHSKGAGREKEDRSYLNAPKNTEAMLPQWDDPELNSKMAPVLQMLFHRDPESLKALEYPLMGANTIELMDDMLTVKGEPKRIVEGQFSTGPDSSFIHHAFYEASSIRKINGTYYFIYSSENSNELCYATSKYPDRDFVYGGTIISNGDVGYKGLLPKERTNMTANDHGSLACINGQWYIFHHRQTHRSTFSRQACVERVEIKEDGSIDQVECTSQGFSEVLLPRGFIPAPVSCVLTNGHMPHCTNTALTDDIPYITHGDGERYITGISDGTKVGYKYFEFTGNHDLDFIYRGSCAGKLILRTEKELLGESSVMPKENWDTVSVSVTVEGRNPLYLIYEGQGSMDLLGFEFL